MPEFELERKVTSGTVSVSMAGADDELRQLGTWLRAEDELRGRVSFAQRPIAAGEMGGVLDTVQVVLNSGTATVLVTSLFAWLGHRKASGKVALRIRDDQGREISLSCGSTDDAADVLRQIRSVLDSDG